MCVSKDFDMYDFKIYTGSISLIVHVYYYTITHVILILRYYLKKRTRAKGYTRTFNIAYVQYHLDA